MNCPIVITGPTASGKSNFCDKIAEYIGGIVVNCDSKQIYKEIPIITAQPDRSSGTKRSLYGYISVTENYSANSWLEDLYQELNQIQKNGKTPIITGGSGLYISAMINGLSNIPKISDSTRYRVRKLQKDLGQSEFYQFAIKNDPIIHEKIHHNDSYRLARAVEVMIETGKSIFDWRNSKKYPLVKSPSTESEAISKEKQERSYIIQMDQVYILLPDRELIYRNINQRFEQMFQLGAVEEVESIMKMNLDSTLPAMKAHGIPEIIEYLKGAITKEAAIEKAQLNTRHYAKRQYTWFKNQFPKAKFFQDTDFSISMLNKDL